ncbi:MAG: 30S ribosomal protein S18 [Anaerolineae bacterium]|nr:30S ribosomal protein S18 [Anaerolineae bacterium]
MRHTRKPVKRGPERQHVVLDYKQPEELKRYLTEYGRIRPRRQTRLSPADQRKLAREVKRARHLALLPFAGQGVS